MDREEFFTEDNPKDEIVELLTEQMGSTKRRLSEIKDQIEQIQITVDREQQRYSGIAAELKTVKENLDTVPREDIRDKYDEALEVRFRLATMRGQLEKIEAQYDYLEKQQSTYSQILTGIEGVDYLEAMDDDSSSSSRGGVDIVGIINAQEEERKRLSRVMHDGPAQSLTNFILQAEICQRLFDRDPERAAAELDNLKTNASRTFQKIRDFIFDLRPMMLDDLGIAATVRRYSESFGEKNDIHTEYEIINEERRMENYREVFIFRTIQELMSMTRDYATATEVKVRLDMASDPIKILVEDDGKGFDSDLVFETDDDSVVEDMRISALILLRNKVALVGGEITVQSNETDGTVIRIEVPIDD
jgi:two-component system, NarL family, sensor histidine kinase DegS